MHKAKVMVVDDDIKILYAFRQVLRKEKFQTIVARNGEEALATIAHEQPAMIFLDITMPKLNGLEVLQKIKEQANHIPTVIITGFGTMHTAIKAVQLGAFDYMTKPLDVTKIREVLKRALSASPDAVVAGTHQTPYDAEMTDRYELIGRSAAMQEVFKLLGSISTTPHQVSVLITGESGTGKELVARAIHNSGPRPQEPFIGINCTVLPEPLLESELFGHEKGAFTGALERKLGKFEIARAGTIFLDEIGNLSPGLQQKLLRVLQEREFERLGGHIPIRVEARFIAATNQDIEREVKRGNFRKDLYYRLQVVRVHLPPLRDRKEDIPFLAQYFLLKYNAQMKKSVLGFSAGAMSLLEAHHYPGNVRELENLIERAIMLTKGDIVLPDTISECLAVTPAEAIDLPIVSPVFSKAREHIVESFERRFLIQALQRHRGNVSSAAQASKMTRQNFQRLMKKYKIQSDEFRK